VQLHYLPTIVDRRGGDDIRPTRASLSHPSSDASKRFSLSGSSLRTAGLSEQKVRYVQNLALAFQDGRVRPRRFSKQSNEEIIAALMRIKGIGRWTVEMFLTFSLNRLDVLPVEDLGIRQSVQRGIDCRPSQPSDLKNTCRALASL